MKKKQKVPLASADLICAVAGAVCYEIAFKPARLEDRNRMAREIFAKKSNRHVMTHDGKIIETWYNGNNRTYVTQAFLNADRLVELQDADTTGHKNDAAVAHLWALARALNLYPKKEEKASSLSFAHSPLIPLVKAYIDSQSEETAEAILKELNVGLKACGWEPLTDGFVEATNHEKERVMIFYADAQSTLTIDTNGLVLTQ